MAGTGQLLRGRISWFGGPDDATTGPTTASGKPVSAPGIAVYDPSKPGGRGETLGGYWRVRLPNGRTAILQQTDVGPHPSTGRKIDFTYSALKQLGYDESSFPTDAIAGARYLGKDPSVLRQGTSLGGGAGMPAGGARVAVDGGYGAAGGLAALLGQLGERERPQIQSSGLAAPSFAAHAVLPQGYQQAPSGGGPVRQESSLAELLGQVAQLQGPQARVVGGQASGGAAGPAAALQFASRRLGTTETAGANRGKLIDKWEQSFGTLGQPWCGIFVGKALQQAGVQGVDSRIASTAGIVDMARKGEGGFAGLVSAKQAQAGDVVVWNPGSNGHTGIVERVGRDGSVTVIEGNASNGVRRRVHPKPGAYYARPAYPVAG